MRRAIFLCTALALAGCHPTPGPAGSAGTVATEAGSLQLTLRVPPEALPGYQTATIPGGSATIVAMLSNGALLGAPRSTTVTLVPGQTLYPVTLASLPVGSGYTLEAEARNGSGARLAFTNQLDPTSPDPALGQIRTVDPFTTPAQTFAISSGINNVNAGLRILPLSGTAQGPTAGSLTGSAQVMAGYKRTLTITSTPGAPAGYVCTLPLHTASLVTGTKLRADMADLHVLYWDGAKYVELYREVENPNTASSEIRFRLQKALPASGSDANYLLTYGNNMTAPAPSDRAQIYDTYDGFGYPDAEITARGWITISGTSAVAMALGQGRSGNALSINSAGGNFNRDLVRYLTYPTDFSLVAWFKDDMDAARNDWIGPTEGYVTSCVLGIFTTVSATTYHYAPPTGGWQNTAVSRTAGWHKYEFRRVNGTMTQLIDGTQVSSAADTRTYRGISLRGGSPGNSAFASTALWDDVSVRPIQASEPAVAVGGELPL